MSAQGVLFSHGKFSVTAAGLRVKGQPSRREWASALQAACNVRSGTQWATGDLLLYADAQGWDAEAVEAAMDATGQKRGTLANLKSVARTFGLVRRKPGLPWSHHALVASLPSEVGDALLRRAEEERWGWEELRTHAREAREARVREEQTWPAGRYGVLLAAPPWKSRRAGAPQRFAPLKTSEIEALKDRVTAIAAPNSVLYLRAPSEKVLNGEAQQVAKAWGFTVRGSHVWVKERLGPGEFLRERHEHLLVATMGRMAPPAEDRRPDSVVQAPERETESVPAEVYAMLEHCYPGVPRVELFATSAREGWVVWGEQMGLQRAADREVTLRDAEAVPA